MHFQNFDNFAIQGTSVTNFILDHCTINGVNGDSYTINPNSSGQTKGEGSVQFYNVLGTCAFTNSTMSGGKYDTVEIVSTSGTLSALTVNNCTFSQTDTGGGNTFDLFAPASSTATLSISVTNSTFTSGHLNLLSIVTNASGTLNATVTGNTFSDSDATTEEGGVRVAAAGSGALTFDVENNTLGGTAANSFGSHCKTAALHVEKAVPTPVVSANATGKIINNHIGTSGHQGSSTDIGANSDALQIDSDGQGTFTVLIKNNDIHGYDEYGMSLFDIEGSVTLNATVIGNTIDTPNTNDSVAGIDITVASAVTDTNLACLHIGSVLGGEAAADKNSISGAPATVAIGQANAFLFNGQAGPTSQINLPGYTGGNTDTTAVTNYLKAANTLADSPFVTFNQVVNNFHNTPGGADCAQPPLLFAPGGIEPATADQFRPGTSMSARTGQRLIRNEGVLDQRKLDLIVRAAKERWRAAGLTDDQIATLDSLRFGVGDLSDGYIGFSGEDRIVFDRKGAGRGWFIDRTPLDDKEFRTAVSETLLYTDPHGAPAGHLDLLTAAMHEIGHKLGLRDASGPAKRSDVMY